MDELESLLAQADTRMAASKLHKHREQAVIRSLRLLHSVLTMQASFCDIYYATAPLSSLPLICTLDHTLLAAADRRGPSVVPSLVLYARYKHDVELSYWAASILLQLSKSPHAKDKLVHIMREGPRDVILNALVARLSGVTPHADPALVTSASRSGLHACLYCAHVSYSTYAKPLAHMAYRSLARSQPVCMPACIARIFRLPHVQRLPRACIALAHNSCNPPARPPGRPQPVLQRAGVGEPAGGSAVPRDPAG